MDGECSSCGDPECPDGECPVSERPCGHHCNCVWVNDTCHWCGIQFGEASDPPITALGFLPVRARRHFVYTAAEMWEIYDEAPFVFTTTFHPLCEKMPLRPVDDGGQEVDR